MDENVSTVRLSLGSAVVLGLRTARMDARPTTLYAMLGDHCLGACQFCAQARDSKADGKFLSRVAWPEFDLDEVLDRLPDAQGIGRVCLQTLHAPGLPAALLNAVTRIRAVSDLSISVCMNPTAPGWLPKLKAAGVDRVGVGLDCATEATFSQIKPGFDWHRYHAFLDEIVEVFGTGSAHLIVGLGDTDEELIRAMQDVRDRGCTVALFAFTLVRGAQLHLPPPDLGRYRALQLARYLIVSKRARIDDMRFGAGRLTCINVPSQVLDQAVARGTPFRTSGCPDCNRPNYNERPGGPMFNHAVPLDAGQVALARDELQTYLQAVPLPAC